MSASIFRTACVSLLVCLLTSAPVLAQSSTGTVSGRIIDPTGAAIAQAEVRLINEATKDARKAATNNDGEFVFLDVPPGAFTVSIQVAGFKRLDKSNLNLAPSDRLAVGDLRLDVGTVNETVEVTAQGAAIQTESSDRSGLLDSRQITELMARGRDVMALLQLMPGAVNDSTGSDTLGQFSIPTIGGTRPAYSALNIDGISGNTARGRTAESPINMDAIAEVKIMTNSYPAEYGTAAGTVVNIVTKESRKNKLVIYALV